MSGRRAERNAETREAILRAAEELFTAQGWQGTRITEVAARAGVATATCYNHFGSKHALLGHLFAPRIAAAVAVVEAQPPADALRVAVEQAAAMFLADRSLTFALFAAVQEETIRSEGPPRGPGDVRAIANVPLILESGLRHAPPGVDAPRTARYHTNGLLLQVLTRPADSAAEIVTFVLTQLAGQNSRRSLESMPRSAS
ncbi:TetR/AcrR family transcriptional regulator [Pseudonocardia pini]|uniref:TetR/AcrR family transcriptional regulator n=1 Tax=Pseudonocardia pini TaxID=2758030 RepID=UPI0015F07D5E|nr:TetR/AcrR family transcriptional regulator [Pseudonocardia pini]